MVAHQLNLPYKICALEFSAKKVSAPAATYVYKECATRAHPHPHTVCKSAERGNKEPTRENPNVWFNPASTASENCGEEIAVNNLICS